MSHAACQGPHRLHLLRLAQLLFGPVQACAGDTLLAGVERNDAQAIRHGHDAQIEPAWRPVGEDELDFGAIAHTLQHAAP